MASISRATSWAAGISQVSLAHQTPMRTVDAGFATGSLGCGSQVSMAIDRRSSGGVGGGGRATRHSSTQGRLGRANTSSSQRCGHISELMPATCFNLSTVFRTVADTVPDQQVLV